MTHQPLECARFRKGGTPDEQRLLNSTLGDAPSPRLKSALFAKLGVAPPPSLADTGSTAAKAPVAGPTAPVTFTSGLARPLTTWITWIGIATLVVGVSAVAGSWHKGFVTSRTDHAIAVTPQRNLDPLPQPPVAQHQELLPQRQSTAAAPVPGFADGYCASLPLTAATLPLPPPHAPATNPRLHAKITDGANLEIQLIDAARSALKEGNATLCLSKLGERKRRIRGGMLEPEATWLKIQALLALGQTQRAQKEGRRYLTSQPTGAISDRIRYALDPSGNEPIRL